MKKRFFTTFLLSLVIVFTFFTGCFATTTIDYKKLVNHITQYEMKANVAIFASYTSGVYRQDVAEGSGVIFKMVNNTSSSVVKYDYYLLTNNHVVEVEGYTDLGRELIYYANSCTNNKIRANLLYSDANYDLALMSFTSEEELFAVEFAINNPTLTDPVFAIGQPDRQNNAITIGSYKGMKAPMPIGKEYSKISFNIISHDAFISGGSSGGMLLDKDLKLIGVNYAAVKTVEDDEFVYACAVPLANIIEFLNASGYFLI